MAASPGCLLFAPLDKRACLRPLRKVSTHFSTLIELTWGPSFYNAEKLHLRPSTAIQIHYTQAGGITGHFMLLCMLLIYTTAHENVRRRSFESFWHTHHLFLPFLLALYTHATGCFVRDVPRPISPFAGKAFWQHCLGYEGWRWELWSFGLYGCERLIREIRCRRLTTVTEVVQHVSSESFPDRKCFNNPLRMDRCDRDSI